MTEKRLLALLGMLIGLVGALLILIDAFDAARGNADLNWLVNRVLIPGILGLAILAGSLLIYRGTSGSGGIINILLGVVVIVLGAGTTGAILAIVSGVLGLVASEAGK